MSIRQDMLQFFMILFFFCDEQCMYQNSLVDMKNRNNSEYKNCQESRESLCEIRNEIFHVENMKQFPISQENR